MKPSPVTLLLCVILWSFSGTVRSCRKDEISYGSSCIRPLLEQDDGAFASVFCMLSGGVQTEIKTQEMLEVLSVRLSSYRSINYWVGLKRTQDNRLKWVDGTPANDLPWIEDGNSSDCFIFTGDKIQDAPCDSNQHLMCTIPKPQYNPVVNCLVGLTEHSFIGEETGNCIYRTPSATTRQNADALCAESEGHFLDLDEILRDGLSTFHEHKVMVNDSLHYWTSLTVNGSDVRWSSGERLQPYINFFPGRGECVTAAFKLEHRLDMELYQTECKDHAYVICGAPSVMSRTPAPAPPPRPQLQQQLSCPKGQNWKVYPVTGNCYWETSFETSRLSWSEAREFCQAYGGELASFHSIDEEKIGLSFQYGSLSHPYWIGLYLDVETGTYKWSDGSPLDYQNWAPGHPDHRDKRLRCVSMDAAGKHWTSSLCGVISWFVCKATKRANPTPPIIPKRKELAKCDSSDESFYFQGYCYNVVNTMSSWHRAKEHCENDGSYLVSIHGDEEIGFILRLLYDDKDTRGNRIWIGLNSLSTGVLKWSDWTPLDFTYWNVNEPNNHQNQEKCVNMYIGNGMWNDENCNNPMGFICKQVKDVNVSITIPPTVDPLVGNCKKGWHPHHDRCYLPVGYALKDQANWTDASRVCENHGGYLLSIRNPKEQAFVAYLMQGLMSDIWIGLHDTIQSGRYYWIDNSDIRYTNWAPGEPSFFGIHEDCVRMKYEGSYSGVWQDGLCEEKLPFICHMQKDPNLPKPEYNRGLECLHPEGWIKHRDMCFKMFAGNRLTYEEADRACRRDGANLVSLSDPSIQAVATYLSVEVNQSFWIGLKYQKSEQRFSWLNERPMLFSKWGKNMPSNADTCYASTADGYWESMPCNTRMPYICQITVGKPGKPKRYAGNCPTSRDWIPTSGSVCHLYGPSAADWFSANMWCFKHGSYLVSIHSLAEVEMVLKTVNVSIKSIFIGLMRNDKNGFMWTDSSPMDFVNWDVDQPANTDDICVEMLIASGKWRVTPCLSKKYYLCSSYKDETIFDDPESEKYSQDSVRGLSTASIVGIVVGSLFVLSLSVVIAIWILRPPLGRSRFRNPFRQLSVSYENALYNVDSASMEFQDGHMDSCENR